MSEAQEPREGAAEAFEWMLTNYADFLWDARNTRGGKTFTFPRFREILRDFATALRSDASLLPPAAAPAAPAVPVSRLRELVAKWRNEVEVYSPYENALAQCADELEAALGAEKEGE